MHFGARMSSLSRFVALALLLTLGSCTTALDASPRFLPGRNSGHVKIHRMSGNIDVPDAPRGVDLTTMSGNIHVGNVGSHAKIKTLGGNIVVDYAEGPVDAATMAGKITIRDLNGPLRATTMAGDITVRVIGNSTQRRDISLESKSGTILLTVPKDFPMEVNIRLAQSANGERTYRIVQQLGLKQQQSTVWDTGFGAPRKYLFATGKVGNGSNRVTINTDSGDVLLKQE